MRGVLAAVVGVLVFATSVMAEPPVRDDEAGWWLMNLILPHVESDTTTKLKSQTLPFLLWLPPLGDPRPAYIKNADEYIEVEHTWTEEEIAWTTNKELVVRFPHYDSEVSATLITEQDSGVEGKQALRGQWTKQRGPSSDAIYLLGGTVDKVWPHGSGLIPVSAIEEIRQEEYKWAIDFTRSGTALGIFKLTGRAQQSDVADDRERISKEVTGTVLTPTGDYRFLSGLMMDDSLLLSVFDGAHAFVFTADVDPDTGDLTNGHFYSGNHWHETFTARRLAEGEEFELPDPFSEVSLKRGVTRLGLPKLNEAAYAGKPVIVQVMGTWCPNCHDEAPVLADLYEKHRADGLQILSLCYEYTDDAERSARQIERFKERHGATWEFVAAGTSDKSKAAATLPALSSIKSYPTTIWVNPDGTVRAIHSGFSGPATGEKHEETLREFERLTREIVEAR